jgi:protein TonB
MTGVRTTPANISPEEEYVAQNKISVLPKFDEKEIRARLIYPAIAQKANIEGSVILELFINKAGFITRVRILKETPEERGFGEAAVRAFTGLRAVPAQANGQPASVRYRYPVRFQLQ